jgi:acyl carrier protein
MSHETILKRLSEIVGDILGLDDLSLTEEMTADQVEGWDSISNVAIMVGVEKAFGMRLRTGEMATLKNVGDLMRAVAERSAGA